MDVSGSKIIQLLTLFCGLAFSLPSLFFAYYTVRLIYLNLTMENAAAYRSTGMLIGAIAFPLAAFVFAFISWYFINKARKGFIKK